MKTWRGLVLVAGGLWVMVAGAQTRLATPPPGPAAAEAVDLVYVATAERRLDGRATKENGLVEQELDAMRVALNRAGEASFSVHRFYTGKQLFDGYRLLVRSTLPVPKTRARQLIEALSPATGIELRVLPLELQLSASDAVALRRGDGIDGVNSRLPHFVGANISQLMASRALALAQTQVLKAEVVFWEQAGHRRLGCFYAAAGSARGQSDEHDGVLFWYEAQGGREQLPSDPAGADFWINLVDTALTACPATLGAVYGRLAQAVTSAKTRPQGEVLQSRSDEELRRFFGPLAPFIKFGLALQLATDGLPGTRVDDPSRASTVNAEDEREREKTQRREDNKHSCQRYHFVRGDTLSFMGC